MQILHKDKKEGGAIYLTDGYFNLAILPNHEQTRRPTVCTILASKSRTARRSSRRLKKFNPNKLPKQRPNGRPYAETRGSDIDGNFFDISEHGFQVVQPVGGKEED